MVRHIAIPSPTHLRHYLVAGYILLIAYASLSPFADWQNQGLEFYEVLTTPLSLKYSKFDQIANLIAYLPFGLLLFLTFHGNTKQAAKSIALATLSGLVLSASMEYVQMFLPSRTSSNLDILANTIGSLTGALLASAITPQRWFDWMLQWRHRLFHSNEGTDFGLALIALWMFAQINPSLPMLGNVFISTTMPETFSMSAMASFDWWSCMATALNLVLVGSLLITLLNWKQHAVIGLLLILCSVALVKFLAAAILLKSWALLLWLNGEAMLGICIGLILLLTANMLPRAWLIWCTAGASIAYLILAHILLNNTSTSTTSLYQWHYGHLLSYNHLSQLILLIFPFLLLVYLWGIRNQSWVKL